MTIGIKAFSEQFRLKMSRDDCGEPIIAGKQGQLYEFGPAKLAVTVLAKSARRWNAARRKLVAAGCRIIQNGDTEGTALFNPGNPEQAGLAIRLIRARHRMQLSDARRGALRELAARARAAKHGVRV